MDKIISLCKRRGFIFPGSEIYGGLANSWDYGPLGAELKNNIRNEWWRWFVHRRTDMVGLDAAILMNPKIWETSGHIQHFSDPLIECKNCHKRFRADHGKTAASPVIASCPDCGGQLTEPKQFNLLFKTFLGPTEEQAAEVYLRGELAQAMFVNFVAVAQTTRKRLPFGIASQGKVFRNEITPGNFIFRTREFDLMEFEYFVQPEEWPHHFDYWLNHMRRWLNHMGVRPEKLHSREIDEGERAHYSQRTVDIDYDYPFGRHELYGIAYRGDFDLRRHEEASGQDLSYTDAEVGQKFLPHVIEPTFGLDRTVLVAILEAYTEEPLPPEKLERLSGETVEETTRTVLKFPRWLAPYKAAVLPLSKKPQLTAIAEPLHRELREAGIVCDYDETQSIGRRYRRQDEIGTPFCVTVDFETVSDRAVTVRDRDTMRQQRIQITEVAAFLQNSLYHAGLPQNSS